MTIQEKMKAKLDTVPIPKKDIDVYGRQIVVTCYSSGAADKWANTLSAFSRVRAIKRSIDYAKENKNTCLLPTRVYVWRVFAAIQ